MRHILLAFAFILGASLTALAQQTTAAVPETRAQAVLKQARAAIWDETKAKPLASFELTANRRQARRDNQIEMTLEAILPDKFLQTVVTNLGLGFGNDLTTLQAINGTQAWSEAINPSSTASLLDMKKAAAAGAGPMVDKRVSLDGGSAGGAKGTSGEGARAGDSAAAQIDQPFAIQSGMAPLLLVWLLVAPPLLPLEFTYAGQAKTQDGKETADVLDVKGPRNFAARLFLDQQTHQVLMLSYELNSPNRSVVKQNPRPADAPAQAEPESTEVEVRWMASEHRKVNGLTLPHRLTRSVGGQLVEEIELQKVKVNPTLKPDRFEKKEKQK
jgi:hypothetical protein